MEVITDKGSIRNIGSTQDNDSLTEIWNFETKSALDFVGFFATKDKKDQKILSLGPIVDVCGRREILADYVFGQGE